MTHELLNKDMAGLPYVEHYFGAWAMLEERFNALRGHAQQINVQLHLEKMQQPQAARGVMAQGSTEYFVTRDGIAVIELRGTMMKFASSFSASASTVAARRKVRAAANDDEVAGILLVLDSPGGTVAGTADLADDVAAAGKQKPVYAYVEDLAASAAYYVASQATKIYANSAAIIGSIGVFNVVYDLSQMAEQEGVQVHVVRFGEFKGAGIPGTKVTDAQLANWQRIVDAFGDDFVAAVASGRSMTRAAAEQLADGRTHKGQAAVDLKLADGIQSMDDALAELVAETRKSQRKGRHQAMSKDTDKNEPTAATLADLKAALPEASNDFYVAQLDASATLEQASAAYVKALAKENAELKAALAKAEEDTDDEDDKDDNKSKGNKKPKAANEPFDDVASDEDSGGGDASEQFHAAVEQRQTAAKCTRAQAVAYVAKKQPELREAMVAEQTAAAHRQRRR